MNRTSDKRISWHKPDNNRAKPCATVKQSGALCFGKRMREELPQKIRVGFLEEECTLFVEADPEQGFPLPKSGAIKITGVAKQLRHLGVDLPVSFLFDEEAKSFSWRGHVVPPRCRRRAKKKNPITLQPEQTGLLPAYKWIIDKAVYQHAKTMPKDERRATAEAALLEALCAYTPICGSMKEYLTDETKKRLIAHNKQYTNPANYNARSIDAPVGEKGLLWSPPETEDRISFVEDQADLAAFHQTYLNPQESAIVQMLQDGYSVPEILSAHGSIDVQRLEEICQSIGTRWEKFQQE